MILYSSPIDPVDHMVRLVLHEKNIEAEIVYVQQGEIPEKLATLNPYGDILTLTDRRLVLYDARIIMEYLDERYPHPPLLSVDPVGRAKNRLMCHRLLCDVYTQAAIIEGSAEIARANARKQMRDNLSAFISLLPNRTYFVSEDFSLADCCLTVILWRLNYYGIKLTSTARRNVAAYRKRMFSRDSFLRSLTEEEKDMEPSQAGK